MNDKPATGTILFEVALLTAVVLLVDESAIRGALAFIPAMLLAQRALDTAGNKVSDGLTGESKLQGVFLEFSSIRHLMRTGGITSEEALQQTNDLEKDLTRLLDEVTPRTQDEVTPPTQDAVGLSETGLTEVGLRLLTRR